MKSNELNIKNSDYGVTQEMILFIKIKINFKNIL